MLTRTLFVLPIFLLPFLDIISASPLLHRHRKFGSRIKTIHEPSRTKIHPRQSYGVIGENEGNDDEDPEDPDFPLIPGLPDLDDPDFPTFPPFPDFPVIEFPGRGQPDPVTPSPDPSTPADPTTPAEVDAVGCNVPATTVTQVQVQKETETITVTSTVEAGGFLDGLFGGCEKKTEVVTTTITLTQPVTETQIVTSTVSETVTISGASGRPQGDQHQHDQPSYGEIPAAPGAVSDNGSSATSAQQTPPPAPQAPAAGGVPEDCSSVAANPTPPPTPQAPAVVIPPTAEHHHDDDHAHSHDSDAYGGESALSNNRDFRDLGTLDLEATLAPPITSPSPTNDSVPTPTYSHTTMPAVPLSAGGALPGLPTSSSPFSSSSSSSPSSSSSSSVPSAVGSASSSQGSGAITTTITSTSTRTFRFAPTTVTDSVPTMPVIEDDLAEDQEELEYYPAAATRV